MDAEPLIEELEQLQSIIKETLKAHKRTQQRKEIEQHIEELYEKSAQLKAISNALIKKTKNTERQQRIIKNP